MSAELLQPLLAALRVTAVLEKLGVPYHLCGSIVSSLHGEPRYTQDIDMVADLSEQHVVPLCELLDQEFFVDAELIRYALEHRISFNLVHKATGWKIDVFVPKDTAFQREQLRRRAVALVSTDPERRAAVATAEDTILAKLVWFVSGDRVARQQLRDVLGIMKLQREGLDLVYLRTWADELQVRDLLEEALVQAGLSP